MHTRVPLGTLEEIVSFSSPMKVYFVPYELQKDKSKLEANLNEFTSESFMLYKSLVETTYFFASLIDEKVTEYYDDIVSN